MKHREVEEGRSISGEGLVPEGDRSISGIPEGELKRGKAYSQKGNQNVYG